MTDIEWLLAEIPRREAEARRAGLEAAIAECEARAGGGMWADFIRALIRGEV